MTRHMKSALLDLTAGFAALVLSATSVLVQPNSPNIAEYMVFVLPAIAFPVATWFRAKKTSIPPVLTFLIVNGWLLLGYWLFAMAVSVRVSRLAVPFTITAGGALLCLITSPRTTRLRKNWQRLGAALLVLVPAGLVAYEVPSTMGDMLTKTVVERAPDVTLQMLDGEATSIAAQRGHVLVINFWGVRCGPCIRELPELDTAAQLLRDRTDVLFFAVDSAIGNETRSQVTEFTKKVGLRVPVAYESDRSAYKAFGVQGLPTTIIVDKEGIIRYRRIGYSASARYGDWLARTIDQLAGVE